MTLRQAITLHRAKHKLSMKEFAALCGVTPQTIYNIESVGQNPSRVTRAKIGLVLDEEFKPEEVEADD